MQTNEIKCDTCGKDLTYTGNCEDYYLVVGSASKASRGGFVTMMGIYPPVDRAHHFCGLDCMDKWRDRARHRTKLWKEWNEIWVRKNGTEHPGGMRSYPVPPDDVSKARDAEIEAAALAAFP